MENGARQTEIASHVMGNLINLLNDKTYHELHDGYKRLSEAEKDDQTARNWVGAIDGMCQVFTRVGIYADVADGIKTYIRENVSLDNVDSAQDFISQHSAAIKGIIGGTYSSDDQKDSAEA